jgi:chaperonin GroES
MKFTPLNDRVLLKRTEAETKTSGGIIIPDSAKEKPLEAIVIAVGVGKLMKSGSRCAPSVAAGDRVLFGKYAGDEVKLDGETHVILREDEILAVVSN